MTYASQDLVIRNVAPVDTAEITNLVAAAMWDCGADAAMDPRHPLEPHHHLAFLAVHPEGRSRGPSGALPDRHHARLDAAGLPARPEANHPRSRDLYPRHGYQVRSVFDPPDGPPLWTMWRSPMA